VAASTADVLIIDLEDFTQPALKSKARDSARSYGVRPWTEQLTPENVASWILAHASYSIPFRCTQHPKAMVFENNQTDTLAPSSYCPAGRNDNAELAKTRSAS
jgi:hypothetical protein